MVTIWFEVCTHSGTQFQFFFPSYSQLKAHSQQGVAIMCRANEEKAKAAIQQEQARAYRAMMRKVYFYTQLQAVDLAAPIPCTIQVCVTLTVFLVAACSIAFFHFNNTFSLSLSE